MWDSFVDGMDWKFSDNFHKVFAENPVVIDSYGYLSDNPNFPFPIFYPFTNRHIPRDYKNDMLQTRFSEK